MIAGITAALAAACVPGMGSAPDAFITGSQGTIVPAASRVATAYSEAATVSLALDRIDQRSLPLDRTYKHFGTGAGVSVYVFDGGVLATHPELVGRVREGFNAFPGEARICNAHGTAVAGAAAGATLGVAPGAEIVDVKMVECRSLRGSIDAIVRGTKWVLADHARHPNQRAIANWSFIADTSSSVPELDSAVKALELAGIPVVVSAGNLEIDACRVAPGNAPGVIVVGASRVRRTATGELMDERAPGTAYGPCIDVFAPGDSVLLPSIRSSSVPTVQLWTGTSMSAGYVSGAIALYLEEHPTAATDVIARHVRESATGAVDSRSPLAGMLFVGADSVVRQTVARR